MSDSCARSARQRVRETLLRQLQGGKWQPGERLPSERQLAQDLAVSRATVREVIQQLVACRLLLCRPGSGIYRQPASALSPASGPDRPSLREQPLWRADMLEFRLMFESGTARLAALRATAAQRRELVAVLARMRRAVGTGDVDAEAAADAAFHELLAASAHNLMIRQFHAGVMATLRQHITRNTYDASRARSEQSLGQSRARLIQHEAIGQAILDHAPAQADEAMRRHILFVGTQFLASGRSAALDIYRKPAADH